MSTQNNGNLIVKILAIGALITLLSYLFHPEVGQISLMINGQPVIEPVSHLAPITVFLSMLVFTIILTALMFFGVGLVVFFGVLIFLSTICFVIAPYFWPILAIVFLIVAIMSISHKPK